MQIVNTNPRGRGAPRREAFTLSQVFIRASRVAGERMRWRDARLGGPSPLVQRRASGTFLVTSQLGQPLEIDAFTWNRIWSTFSDSFKGWWCASGELQACLLPGLGCIAHEHESRCELAPFAPPALAGTCSRNCRTGSKVLKEAVDQFSGQGLRACWRHRDIYVKKRRYTGSVIDVAVKRFA